MTLIIFFFDSYILHAKYRRLPITNQLISRPEKVRIFMITKTRDWSVLCKNKLMVFIRIA